MERGTRTEALRFDSKTFDVSTVNTCIFAHIRNLHTHTRTHTQGNLYVSTSGICICAELLEGEREGRIWGISVSFAELLVRFLNMSHLKLFLCNLHGISVLLFAHKHTHTHTQRHNGGTST